MIVASADGDDNDLCFPVAKLSSSLQVLRVAKKRLYFCD